MSQENISESGNKKTSLEGTTNHQETMVPVKYVKWREKRGEGWSETQYSGIALSIDGIPVIISKLSHGLRVLPKKVDSEYLFDGIPVVTKVSESFISAAKTAFDADKNFQASLGEYEKALSDT